VTAGEVPADRGSGTWVPGVGDSGSLGNGMERLLLGVELGGEDAEEDVERESDGVRVRARGRRKAILRYLSMGEG
jgi:hypothetical protein